MKQKGFIFLLIFWSSSLFAAGNMAANPRLFSLGCQAVIPCQQSRSDSRSFKWFYKTDDHSNTIQMYFQTKSGVEYHQQPFRPGMRVLPNRSLVIDPLTEDDQGIYWCENCFQDNCHAEQPTVVKVKKEILHETFKTCYVTAGSSYTHACPGELTALQWTFEASVSATQNSGRGAEPYSVTTNKSIYIANVKRAHAGKYTCGTSGCDGHKRELLIISLCVVTERHGEDSCVSSAVVCDEEFGNITPNSTSNVETTSGPVQLDGSLNCSAEQMFDGCTHQPSNALNTTTDTEPQNLFPVIYGLWAVSACLLLIALLICYFTPRLRAAFPFRLCCCGLNGSAVVEERISVVYSSVIIRSPDKTTTNRHLTDNSCVYSEIQV